LIILDDASSRMIDFDLDQIRHDLQLTRIKRGQI